MRGRAAKRAVGTTPEALFGQVVRELRQARGLSQEQLGFESGHHRTYISLIERGGRNPSLKTILALASALRTPPSQLLQALEVRVNRGRSSGPRGRRNQP
jgi:transcriptional regulator with XRE-family HTH domain